MYVLKVPKLPWDICDYMLGVRIFNCNKNHLIVTIYAVTNTDDEYITKAEYIFIIIMEVHMEVLEGFGNSFEEKQIFFFNCTY